MKAIVVIVCVLALTLSSVVVYLFSPVKHAVKEEDLLNIAEPYYLVKWIQTTGSSWMIIGDQDGLYDEPILILITGEWPSIVKSYEVAIGHNTYICYGYYVGESKPYYYSEHFSEYHFTGWDILYPIKREGILPFLPKSYLCRLDTLG
ncbi:MAG: hypothetical protein FWE41_06040 [Coriobacteriia bacterium]|nr:hypothetical protein [Coriobacteriia bacterium]MCL2749806.1 hypothetical protein [Coriobacteriia bacterium]